MSIIQKTPNWNDLKIFLEVVRTGTLSGAARRMKIDVSTVSRHITHLEADLGGPVCERDPLGLRITPRGRALVAHVEAMELHAVAVGEAADRTCSTPTGSVRLATMEGIASLYLAEQLVAFKDRYSQVNVELVTSANLVHVSQREADLFLGFFPSEGKGLEVSPLGQFDLHLYASASYLEQHGRPEQVEDLGAHAFVSYIDDLVQLDTVRWLQEAIPHPRTIFHTTSMVAQMFSAVAGGGIVMLPSFARPERFGLIRLLDDKIEVSRTIWITVHRDLQYSSRIKAVVSFLNEIMNRDYPVSSSVRSVTVPSIPIVDSQQRTADRLRRDTAQLSI